MTIQEEIREGLEELLEHTEPPYFTIDNILAYLHSQGVVIKVDRELPDYPTGEDCLGWYSRVQQDMLEAGCGFFEPLIKDDK